jgi:hypothetical protein
MNASGLLTWSTVSMKYWLPKRALNHVAYRACACTCNAFACGFGRYSRLRVDGSVRCEVRFFGVRISFQWPTSCVCVCLRCCRERLASLLYQHIVGVAPSAFPSYIRWQGSGSPRRPHLQTSCTSAAAMALENCLLLMVRARSLCLPCPVRVVSPSHLALRPYSNSTVFRYNAREQIQQHALGSGRPPRCVCKFLVQTRILLQNAHVLEGLNVLLGIEHGRDALVLLRPQPSATAWTLDADHSTGAPEKVQVELMPNHRRPHRRAPHLRAEMTPNKDFREQEGAKRLEKNENEHEVTTPAEIT